LVLGIESNRPTEITLTLDESAPGEDVVVEPLRAATGGEIRDVSLVLAGGSRGTLTLNAKVPSALPPDRYTGALLDGPSGKPRGRLTIAVMD
jgi:hypothetical protein